VLALTGENGAGKSTLSKIIGGLVTPTTGQMQFKGRITALAAAPRLKSWACAWSCRNSTCCRR
jgi:ABC-type sugar transport system ATPase subunit